jgi:putative MATE family efflux protein
VGTGLTVARALGSRQDDEVFRYVHTALPAALVCGGILSVFGVIFSPALLKMMGTPEDVLPLSSLYMRIYFAGMVFNMVYNFCAAILRAVGDTKSPLLFLTISGVANVVMNLFFVLVCEMNVAGVALATTISQGISAFLVVAALMRRTDSCRLSLRKIRIYKKQLLSIFRIGIPAGLQGSLFSISNVIITSSINSFQSAAIISGNGTMQNIESFIVPINTGFSQAAPNFIAQNLGAHQYGRIKKAYRICIGYNLLFMFSASMLIYAFADPLLSLYITDSPDAIKYAMIRMYYVTLPYCLMGIMDNSSNALRGIGASMSAMFITLAGACGLRILWIYTIFQIPKCHNLACLYQSYPVSWVITFAIEAIMFFILVKKKEFADTKYTAEVAGGTI